MRIIHGIKNIRRRFRKPVLTIGIFDGVHLGHQALFKKVAQRARAIGGRSVAVTFDPHPLKVLNPKLSPPTLTSTNHKLKLIARTGIDVCVVISFTKKLSSLAPRDFVKHILVDRIGACEIFTGFDFTFGKGKKAGVEVLKALGKRYGFRVVPVKLIRAKGSVISSTNIRRLIEKGELKQAAQFLGRPVSILGTVIKGTARGRLLGFPTANIDPHHETIPPSGVYAVKVELGKKRFNGILNIGTRPTFKPITHHPLPMTHIEVHIFDFHRSIYGKEIEISFVRKIRKERRFSSRQALRSEIKNDAQKARLLFLNN